MVTGGLFLDWENEIWTWKSKTLRVEYDRTSLKNLGQQVVEFLSVSRGHLLKLSYTISNTEARQFEEIRTNKMFMEVLRTHLQRVYVEMFPFLEQVNVFIGLLSTMYKKKILLENKQG